MSSRRIAPGVLVAVALWTMPAASQTESRQQKAEKLAQAGELLFDAGKYEDALRQFLDAYDLFDPPDFVIPEVLWNIARCYEETGDDLSALRYFEEFRSVAATPEYRQAVDERLGKVRERLAGEVAFEVSPPGAQVWLDGRPLPLEDGKALRRLDPGVHTLKVQARGFHDQERSFRVEPKARHIEQVALQPVTGVLEVTPTRADWQGEVRVLVDGREVFQGTLPARVEVPAGWRTVRLEADGIPEARMEALEIPEAGTARLAMKVPDPAPSTTPVLAAPPEAPGQGMPAADGRRRGAWAAIGTGLGLAVLGAGGIGLGAWDRSRITSAATAPDGTVTGMDEAEAHRLADRARTWDIAGGVLMGVGGAAILTGVILHLVRPRSPGGAAGIEPVLSGSVGPGSAQVVAHLRW
ncbi:MAG TPA: tetratricopeptide repeat protein [Myxococcota bacterium]|nr:tetratricopeptide repeat protein [Myxococcota bacterium]HQK49906.1 tetratricopeptide repeat protein [Myxococcota bacterium]